VATVSELLTYVRRRTGDATFDKDTAVFRDVIRRALRRLQREYRWSFFRVREEVNVTASVSTGTVSLTHGNTAVTGSGTAFASTDVDNYFTLQDENVVYRIASRSSTTAIVLASQYVNASEDNVSDAEYRVMYHDYALSNACAKLITVFNREMMHELTWMPSPELERRIFEEPLVTRPEYFGMYPDGSGGNKLRLWPAPDRKYPIVAVYDRIPSDPSTSDDTATVDWPGMTDALEAACFYEACLNGGNASAAKMLGLARSGYQECVALARKQDESVSGPIVFNTIPLARPRGTLRVSSNVNIYT